MSGREIATTECRPNDRMQTECKITELRNLQEMKQLVCQNSRNAASLHTYGISGESVIRLWSGEEMLKLKGFKKAHYNPDDGKVYWWCEKNRNVYGTIILQGWHPYKNAPVRETGELAFKIEGTWYTITELKERL